MATVRKSSKKPEIQQREELLIETAVQILLSEWIAAPSIGKVEA